MNTDERAQRNIRQAFILLGAMTLATFGGPILFWLVLRQGDRTVWPPDRAIEWGALVGISTLVLAILSLCVARALTNQSITKKSNVPPQDNHTASP